MIHPSDPETRRPVAVRDGHGAPVTCSACGCRLRAGTADNDIAWFHFNPLGGRDARGCKVECVDAPHDVAGYRAVSRALACRPSRGATGWGATARSPMSGRA